MSLFEEVTRGLVEHVTPVRAKDARGLVAAVYEQVERDFALAPPLTVHSPAPELLAAVWAATRESLIVGEGRTTKEAIAAAVSTVNACPFCVDVHSLNLDRTEIGRAIVARKMAEIRDAEVVAAVRFAFATRTPGDAAARWQCIPEDRRLAYAGTAVTFHYVNRIVNVFMRDSSPLKAAGFFRGPISAIASKTIGRSLVSVVAAPGDSLALIGRSPPIGVRWIDDDSLVGSALSALLGRGSRALGSLVSESTHAVLEHEVLKWQGEEPPIGKAWLADALSSVPEHELPVARLALLTALAAYAVGDGEVAAVRSAHPGDDVLVRIAAWGASAAARRVAMWIGGMQ